MAGNAEVPADLPLFFYDVFFFFPSLHGSGRVNSIATKYGKVTIDTEEGNVEVCFSPILLLSFSTIRS